MKKSSDKIFSTVRWLQNSDCPITVGLLFWCNQYSTIHATRSHRIRWLGLMLPEDISTTSSHICVHAFSHRTVWRLETPYRHTPIVPRHPMCAHYARTHQTVQCLYLLCWTILAPATLFQCLHLGFRVFSTATTCLWKIHLSIQTTLVWPKRRCITISLIVRLFLWTQSPNN
jgi:hypothetical protein